MNEISLKERLNEAIVNYDRIEVNNLLKSFPDIVRESDILHQSVQYQRDDDAFGIFLDLLEAGADPVFVDRNGNTVLHQLCWTKYLYAQGFCDEEIVDILIRRGVPINLRNNEQLTPLWLASAWFREDPNVSLEGNSLECCLIAHGANVNYANAKNVTPLHLAAIHDDLPFIRFLICCGANLNPRTISDDGILTGTHSALPIKKGTAPLDLCSSVEARDMLLEAGAVPGIVTKIGP